MIKWTRVGLLAHGQLQRGQARLLSLRESQSHIAEVNEQFTLQAASFNAFKIHSDQDSLSEFVKLGQLQKGDTVLDSGCGPGIVSRYLARFVAKVVGVDITSEMLKVARETAAKQPEISNKLSYVEGNMTALPFADNSFSAAVTRYTFHHLEHPAEALKEMARVVKPGGRIVVIDATPTAAKQAAYNAFELLRDPSHTKALTRSELLALGDDLVRQGTVRDAAVHASASLAVDAAELVEKAHPTQTTKAALIDMLAQDAGHNHLDFDAQMGENGRLQIFFPRSAAVWVKA